MARLTRLHPAAYRRPVAKAPALPVNRMNPLPRSAGMAAPPVAQLPGGGQPPVKVPRTGALFKPPWRPLPMAPTQMPGQAMPQNPYSPGSPLDQGIGGNVIDRFKELLRGLSGGG